MKTATLKTHRPSPKPKGDRYWSHTHNLEGGLRNGSFFVQRKGKDDFAQFINGDYMGRVAAVPEGQTETTEEIALQLLPRCCGGRGSY